MLRGQFPSIGNLCTSVLYFIQHSVGGSIAISCISAVGNGVIVVDVKELNFFQRCHDGNLGVAEFADPFLVSVDLERDRVTGRSCG